MVTKLPTYFIKRAINSEFYWVLDAINGETILKSSEQYTSKQNCIKSINSSKRNVADSNFRKLISSNGKYYFLQIAGNFEELGISQMYASIHARDNGITLVKRDAPIANIVDLTT